MHSRPLARSIASTLVALAVSSILHAQEPAAAGDDLDEVVLTGSRIARNPNDTAPLPISTVTAADLQAAGNSDVTATLRQTPALISSSTVADSIERGPDGTIGQATLNLRQLGSNRTLVLIDGYRHVSGVAGSQAVDVSTIPSALIERVEVLTGGASAVYGADAVTGVVNYVLKKDFEGVAFDIQPGISSRGDGTSKRFEATFGKNFADGRGNVTLSAGLTDDAEVLFGDREFTRDNGRANNSTTYGNPLKRFQRGDIVASTMPNFANRFRLGGPGASATRFPYGPVIPTPAQVATLFPGGITAAEQALVTRAANAPLFSIGRDARFAISSGAGLIFRADFDFFGTDINNNGVRDCNESYIGRTGFGGGGCYVSTPGGGVKVFQDGVISTGSNQFGGDGAVERTNDSSLLPGSERVYANIRGSFEFSPLAEAFVDAKFAKNDATRRNSYNTFYDSLLIFPDNPFIPAVLQGEANAAGGLRVSRDMLDLGSNLNEIDRNTLRVLGGLRGAFSESLKYELALNYGRTNVRDTLNNRVLPDRLFAAIDVVRDANGQPVCRSDISRTPHPGSEIFPVIEGGFFTFTPGDGSCRPASLFNGEQSITPAARDFITTATTDYFRLEQRTATLSLSGNSSPLFSLPAGPVQFALGGEYREEKSSSRFSDLELGLLPAGSPAGAAGTFIGDISGNQQLVFDGQTRTFNAGGTFDVSEFFAEVSAPLARGMFLAEEITIGAAARYADYSTIGGATTWNVNAVWAPVADVRVRATLSEAIRAPNISELFDPQQGETFRPSDPCDQTTQNATPNRRANCIAAATALGIPNPATFIANYSDPLTARFSGTSGGNPDLAEEKANTWTVGAVFLPRWVPGLSLSVDYYSIEIEDAIAAVTAQDIVNTCYDNATFPNQFCDLIRRNGPGAGQTAFGFNFLQQTQLNFGRIETSGVDMQLNYGFGFRDYRFAMNLAANWTEKLNRFFDPIDTSLVNPGLNETGAPEWSGVGSLNVTRGPATVTWQTQYIGRQALASAIQIERIDEEFGPAGFASSYLVHNLSGNYQLNDNLTAYAGVNNLADKEPYIASSAYPVSGMGRFYFAGLRARF